VTSAAARRLRLAPLTLLFLAACTDAGPVSAAGTLTASLVSPNGPEGAAVVVLFGDGLGPVSTAGGADVYSREGVGSMRVVLIHPTGGEIAFQVAVADTTQPPTFVIQEVAGPDDALRPDLSEYSVEVVR